VASDVFALSSPQVTVDPELSVVDWSLIVIQYCDVEGRALIIPLVSVDLSVNADGKETRLSSPASIFVVLSTEYLSIFRRRSLSASMVASAGGTDWDLAAKLGRSTIL
jgi:hypothetical protein